MLGTQMSVRILSAKCIVINLPWQDYPAIRYMWSDNNHNVVDIQGRNRLKHRMEGWLIWR